MSDEQDFVVDGVSYDDAADYLWVGVLGGCGCGSADLLADKAVAVLKNFELEPTDPSRFYVGENVTNELLAHWLDSKGLLEHGGSVSGSWLTDKGKEVLQLIKDYEEGKNAS